MGLGLGLGLTIPGAHAAGFSWAGSACASFGGWWSLPWLG